MMHFRFWNLWQVFFRKQPCQSDMVKKHTSADRRSRKNEPALTDLRKRVYHCKKKGYFRKNGRETEAVTGLWQPPETTSEEEGKRCAVHTEKYKKTFKNGRLQPHRKDALSRLRFHPAPSGDGFFPGRVETGLLQIAGQHISPDDPEPSGRFIRWDVLNLRAGCFIPPD